MLYTSQIPEIFNSTRKTRVLQHYWQKLRIQDVLFIYFEQFVSLFANFYSCFVKNQACFRQISQKRVICQIPSLVITTHCLLLSHYMNFWQGTLKRPSASQVWSGQKCDVLQLALSFGKLCHNATAHPKGLIKNLASALPADYKCIFCIMVIITDRKSTDKDVSFMGPWAANKLYLWNMFNQEWTIQNVEFDIFI